MMTVQQLIDLLSAMPKDAHVWLLLKDVGFGDANEVYTITDGDGPLMVGVKCAKPYRM